MTHNINEENIRVAAYYIWEQAGRPEGKDKECWIKACEQLFAVKAPKKVAKKASRTIAKAISKPVVKAAKKAPKAKVVAKPAAKVAKKASKAKVAAKPSVKAAATPKMPVKKAAVAHKKVAAKSRKK